MQVLVQGIPFLCWAPRPVKSSSLFRRLHVCKSLAFYPEESQLVQSFATVRLGHPGVQVEIRCLCWKLQFGSEIVAWCGIP